MWITSYPIPIDISLILGIMKPEEKLVNKSTRIVAKTFNKEPKLNNLK